MKANQLINLFPNRRNKQDHISDEKDLRHSDDEIKPGMSAEQISAIVSDKIINLIKAQFKATEENYYKTNPK